MGTKGTAALLILLTALMVTACGASSAASTATQDTDISEELTYTESMELSYAEEFCVDYYENDFALITIAGSARYLLVPEGETAPEGLDEDIVILQQPIENIYLVASAVMDMFVSMDALDAIRFSGTQADGWYIEEAKTAMENGDILYAGKYSAPDYEQILAENCGLAIENTMIYHTPEVQEQLEKFGIPVLVDYSSYEAEPLGRTEWVKLYGLLAGEEEAAEEAFAAEIDEFATVADAEQTGLTVAFFYITTNGEANVRQSSDYLPKMIELAGGTYIFEDLGDEDTASSTVTMTMEEFYAGAKDADYIIYNSTIDGELTSVDELLGKSSLLENFSAVQNGNVYCTSRNLYQSSMELGTITADIHRMLTGEDGELTYLYKLE
ncbi:MAG: ABC transporter substrate-binding protein [Lachnospiraceae bacterium]|nr:ABC transporter substrate-binding protein [Lachnospiraceae bacterium]